MDDAGRVATRHGHGAAGEVGHGAAGVVERGAVGGVERGATRAADEPAAPPTGLTVEDCLGAGFRPYGNCLRRSRAGVTVRVYFSYDARHHAVLLEARRGRRGTFVWIDGRRAPAPVGLDGGVRSASLAHWLEHRFTMRVLGDGEDPALALSMWGWMTEVGRIAARGRRGWAQEYPAPPAGVTPADYRELGSEFEDERCAFNYLDETGKSTIRVFFSADLRHQAMLIGGPDWFGTLLWVDGEPVPVPCDQGFGPLCEQFAEWLDARFVCTEIGGLWDHPLYDPAKINLLGEIRGLLIWDALRRVRHIVLPRPTEAWRSPMLRVSGDSWRIYPDGQAYQQDRPDRVLPIPR
ncbi:hypothetical protein [Nonomuraea sp. NPDC049129]|uniref:hypothetical protein n=1 Tax=Nonomuraea sp. NPDC049129 TaxID=3155272 RepID=UPI00340783CE